MTVTGMVVGAINAADRLNWHAAEVLIPALPGAGLQLVAWLVFLLQAGAVAYAYTRFLLGAMAATSDRAAPAAIASITAVLLLAGWMLRGFDPQNIPPPAIVEKGRIAIIIDHAQQIELFGDGATGVETAVFRRAAPVPTGFALLRAALDGFWGAEVIEAHIHDLPAESVADFIIQLSAL